MRKPFRVHCSTIPYRRGFFEVTPGIHVGRVNIEAWTIHPEWPAPTEDQPDVELPDDAVTGNVEIELTAPEARQLAVALLDAADAAEQPQIFELDGASVNTLEEFYAEVSRSLIPDSDWGHNLDAFNDILRGGFGTPNGGFRIVWRNHQHSRERLGYPETIRQLQLRVERCHPDNREVVGREIETARRGEGQTVFDWLVEIIRDHGPGGNEAADGVILDLQ